MSVIGSIMSAAAFASCFFINEYGLFIFVYGVVLGKLNVLEKQQMNMTNMQLHRISGNRSHFCTLLEKRLRFGEVKAPLDDKALSCPVLQAARAAPCTWPR